MELLGGREWRILEIHDVRRCAAKIKQTLVAGARRDSSNYERHGQQRSTGRF